MEGGGRNGGSLLRLAQGVRRAEVMMRRRKRDAEEAVDGKKVTTKAGDHDRPVGARGGEEGHGRNPDTDERDRLGALKINHGSATGTLHVFRATAISVWTDGNICQLRGQLKESHMNRLLIGTAVTVLLGLSPALAADDFKRAFRRSLAFRRKPRSRRISRHPAAPTLRAARPSRVRRLRRRVRRAPPSRAKAR